MDDILIYSESLLEYKLYIKKILYWLQKVRLQINIKKNEFDIISIKFLRFIISTDGMVKNLEKILVVKDWKPLILIKRV